MNPLRPVKVGLWIYFWLLLLEGALRKWVFPQWSDVLFVIRDPVALAIYVLAWRAQIFPRRPAMVVIWLLAVLSLLFSFSSEAPFFVTLFGLRTNYLHLPLVFVIAQAFNRHDVVRMGWWTLAMSIPVLILMIVQFNSPLDSWVNVGVGGQEGGQLPGAMGRVRAPGPFSFISGVVSYFGLVAAFALHGWLQKREYGRFLPIVVTIAIASAIAVSISRSLLLTLLIVTAFGLVAPLRDWRRLPAYVGPVIAVIALFLFQRESVYVEAFRTRWDEALGASKGSYYENVVTRVADDLLQPFTHAARTPFRGHGVGVGTVAGARLMTGKYQFLLAETELGRIVLELGPALGFAFILWRTWFAGLLIWQSWQRLRKQGDTLPWMLTGQAFLPVMLGQWGQATQLGFAVLGSGLVLAALNDPDIAPPEEPAPEPAA